MTWQNQNLWEEVGFDQRVEEDERTGNRERGVEGMTLFQVQGTAGAKAAR